jgi:hypothetical protein
VNSAVEGASRCLAEMPRSAETAQPGAHERKPWRHVTLAGIELSAVERSLDMPDVRGWTLSRAGDAG